MFNIATLQKLYRANRDRVALSMSWPGPKARNEPPRLGGWERFQSYESSDGYVTVGDSDSIIFGFSGQPDHIELFVLDNAAIVSFVDDAGLPSDEIRLEASNFYAPSVKAHALRARNATSGLVARIQVIGKWDSRL